MFRCCKMETDIIDVCCICLNDINKENNETIKCNHSFHKEWKKRSNKCPLCIRDIDTQTDSQLMKTIRTILKNNGISINHPDFKEQFDAINRFARGEISYAEMRSIAG